MDIKEVRANAKERMKGFCRVCPVCDGRACAGETPGMGGIGTGSAFKNNVAALAGIRLNMRLIHEVKKPVTETEVLGFRLRLPVLAAPIGGTSFNMGGALSEAEYARAIVSGCREAGIVGCVGDGAPDELHEAGNAAIAAEGGWGDSVHQAVGRRGTGAQDVQGRSHRNPCARHGHRRSRADCPGPHGAPRVSENVRRIGGHR